MLELYTREKLAGGAMTSPTGGGFSGVTLAYNARSEAEVDETLENDRREDRQGTANSFPGRVQFPFCRSR